MTLCLQNNDCFEREERYFEYALEYSEEVFCFTCLRSIALEQGG